MITNQDFTMVAGDSMILSISIDVEGSLDDFEVKWSLARFPTSTGNNVLITKSTDTPPDFEQGELFSGVQILDNVINIALEPSDTANLPGGVYYHEAKIKDPIGAVYTIMTGKATVRASLIKQLANT